MSSEQNNNQLPQELLPQQLPLPLPLQPQEQQQIIHLPQQQAIPLPPPPTHLQKQLSQPIPLQQLLPLQLEQQQQQQQQKSAMDSNQRCVTIQQDNGNVSVSFINNNNNNNNNNKNNEMRFILVNQSREESESKTINSNPTTITSSAATATATTMNLANQYSDDVLINNNKNNVESELISLKQNINDEVIIRDAIKNINNVDDVDDVDIDDDDVNVDIDIADYVEDHNNDDIIIIDEIEKKNSLLLLGQQQQHQQHNDLLTVTHIKDFLKTSKDEMEEISLHEELDALSPLMTDNHTETFVKDLMLQEERVFPEFIPRSRLRLADTKDSISSIDSDLSLSYDRRNSQESKYNSQSADSSDNDNNKDSGCETIMNNKINSNDLIQLSSSAATTVTTITEQPIEIPDDELAEKIIEQVEFYFSNENILKDAFLLKHVRRNKEGFVSLKLISSFKRVRQLEKDWRAVGYAIKLKSKKVELNDLETKVRRFEPLPNYDETTPSRTVIATDLPFEKVTIEKVSDLFSKCGEIALVRILRPSGIIPADVRQFINKHIELQQNECALVEFVESNSARIAQNMEGLRVYEMIAPKKKTGKKQSVTKLIENCKFNDSEMERSRGGGSGGGVGICSVTNDYQYRLKRNNSGNYFTKPDFNMCTSPRKISFNNENNFEHFHRRISNCSTASASDTSRKFSNCSDGYSSCSDNIMSRRPSNCSDLQSRRTSNCSDLQSRRTSNCSEHCHCSRRLSQCSEVYRRMSQCSSDHNNRKFSTVSTNSFEQRRLSNASTTSDIGRRISIDSNFERKFSNGNINNNINYEQTRKFSNNGFDPIRQITNSEQYCGNRKYSTDSYDRRISIDSGYDRKLSMCSDYSGPRSRSNSIYNTDNVVRCPIGPDGVSKGFSGSRIRKVGQTLPPI